MEELVSIVKENFPYLEHGERRIRKVLGKEDSKIFEKRIDGKLIGVSVVNKNVVDLFFVDKEYRNQGIGSDLLKQTEEYVLEQGYKSIKLGKGDGHIFLGVPSSVGDVKKDYPNVDLYKGLDDIAYNFFKKRGYSTYWDDGDVFDMHMDLKDTISDHVINDTINGICYRKANKEDKEKILECLDDSCKEFKRFYDNEYYFEDDSDGIALIAVDKDEVVGTLLVSENGGEVGSIGCMSVKHNHRRQGIATYLAQIGTKYLQDKNVKRGFLCFTHTGLEKLYGSAGYKICIFYFMASKKLHN